MQTQLMHVEICLHERFMLSYWLFVRGRSLLHRTACCGKNDATCRTTPQHNTSGVNEP